MWYHRFCILTFLILSSLLIGCQSPAASPSDTTEQEAESEQGAQISVAETAVTPDEGDEPWTAIHQTQEEHLPSYVAFANPEFGITSCTEGDDDVYNYITSDGGSTWEAPNPCNFRTDDVDIVDGQSIWVCAEGNLLSSKDSGQSWNPYIRPYPEGCTMLSFLDDDSGWAAGKGKLVATEDGGNSWVEIPLPEGIQELAAVSLRTKDDGYLLDFDRTLYSTNDGGQSWSDQTLDIEDSDLQLSKMGRIPAAAVKFTDDENGVVILTLAGGGKSKILALHTSDGGQTWEHHDVPTELGAIYLSNDGAYLTVTIPGKGITIFER